MLWREEGASRVIPDVLFIHSRKTVSRAESPLYLWVARQPPPRAGHSWRRRFEAAPEPKELLILDGGAHNDLYDHPQVAERVIAFLRRHAPTVD